MKILAAAALALLVSGCAILQALEGGGGTGGSSSGSGAGGGSSSAQGINCGTDPDTSATLCLGSSVCPGLVVDSEVFPGCGYRVKGNTVDIECSCGGFLCPLGATSCADAKQKLTDENYGVVCSQVGAGACVEGTPAASSTSSSSGGSCDTACRNDCAGEPTCIQACGC